MYEVKYRCPHRAFTLIFFASPNFRLLFDLEPWISGKRQQEKRRMSPQTLYTTVQTSSQYLVN